MSCDADINRRSSVPGNRYPATECSQTREPVWTSPLIRVIDAVSLHRDHEVLLPGQLPDSETTFA